MPNWCNNTLTVSGPAEDLQKFMKAAEGHGHDYYGPLNKKRNLHPEEEEVDDSVFVSLMMELMMRDDGPPTSEDKKPVPLSFHSLFPVPKEVMLSPYDPKNLQDAKEKYSEFYQKFPVEHSGYDWEHKYWGVKWGACDAELMDDSDPASGQITYGYDTAWGPPSESFFRKVSLDFPTLNFSNEWGGCEMNGGGYTTYAAGLVTDYDEWDEEEDYEDDYRQDEEPFFEEGEEYQHEDSIIERES